MHTHMHTYIHTYRQTDRQPDIHTHTCIRTCIHTYLHTYLRKYIHPSTHTCIFTYIHTYTNTYINPSIHPYIHKYIHTTYIRLLHTHLFDTTCIYHIISQHIISYIHVRIGSFYIYRRLCEARMQAHWAQACSLGLASEDSEFAAPGF